MVMIRVIVLVSMCVGALGSLSEKGTTTPSVEDQIAMVKCMEACPKLIEINEKEQTTDTCRIAMEASLCMSGVPECGSWKSMVSHVAQALKDCDAAAVKEDPEAAEKEWACMQACPKLIDIDGKEQTTETCRTVMDGALCMAGVPECDSWKSMASHVAQALNDCSEGAEKESNYKTTEATGETMKKCMEACPKLMDIGKEQTTETCRVAMESALCMAGVPECDSWKSMASLVAEALKDCDAAAEKESVAGTSSTEGTSTKEPRAIATSGGEATKAISVLALTAATVTLFA